MAYAKESYSPDEVMSCDCPLCDGNDFSVVLVEKESLRVVECNICALTYVSPRLKDPGENYTGEDQKGLQETAKLFSQNKIPHHRDQSYRYVLDTVRKYKSGGELLDIGSHTGHFLHIAREYGYDVTGVEPSAPLSEIAKKYYDLNIITALLDQASLGEQSVDIVTLIDVFEHITNPKEMLREISRVIKDDGIVCIKVPNGNYNKLKLKLSGLIGRKDEYDLFDSYEHVVHYSIKTMDKMARECGFLVNKSSVPVPIHTPNWPKYVGYSLDYRMPFALDWKKIILRQLFYMIGRVEHFLGLPVRFGPDLMFILKKTKEG